MRSNHSSQINFKKYLFSVLRFINEGILFTTQIEELKLILYEKKLGLVFLRFPSTLKKHGVSKEWVSFLDLV